MIKKMTGLLALFVLTGWSGVANGFPITIVNASFENPTLTDGSSVVIDSVVDGGWVPDGGVSSRYSNPTTAAFTPEASDGQNILEPHGTGIDGPVLDLWVSQVLSDVLLPNVRYTLSMKVGRPSATSAGARLALYAGGNELARTTIPVNDQGEALPHNAWATMSLTFEADVSNPLLGQLLEIRLSRHSRLNGSLYVDDVRLDAEVDSDSDGVFDSLDNCLTVANSDQRDTDGDSIGNSCDPDHDQNCTVNFIDLGMLKAEFFGANPDYDYDGDGAVNFVDLGRHKEFFFGAPGPSGLPNVCGGA